jgi:hypothetical protein
MPIALALTAAFCLAHGAMYAPQARSCPSSSTHAACANSGASLGAQLASVFACGLAPCHRRGTAERGYGRGAVAVYVIRTPQPSTIVASTRSVETQRSEVD